MDRKLVLNISFWIVLITVAASLFGSPHGAFAEYWFWWPTEAKAQAVNALAIFGFGALAIGAWAAINKPDQAGKVTAWIGLFLIAFGVGPAVVDCSYLFRCL